MSQHSVEYTEESFVYLQRFKQQGPKNTFSCGTDFLKYKEKETAKAFSFYISGLRLTLIKSSSQWVLENRGHFGVLVAVTGTDFSDSEAKLHHDE